jgi:putative protease
MSEATATVELLAPAGGLEAAYAALHYGANAVYLGAQNFSARADAENFTLDQISEVTGFAHSLAPRRRVFVTVNTLIQQRELPALLHLLGALSEIGVDALIVQDLGAYAIIHRHFPEFALHASTQLAIHNLAGAQTLRQLGFKRVTLARELTLEEVRAIAANRGIETEVFVHGALCYSYSGLCLFSSQTTGRSGNRGRCAYPCRDAFGTDGAKPSARAFAFSMKDLAMPDYLAALRSAGVAAFKIEGRKKSPLYVAAVASYYRKLLDGQFSSDAARAAHEAEIKTVFSRPWTRLFMQSRRGEQVADAGFVGHRGQPLGKVEAVFRSRSGQAFLRLKISQEIERHDGLQIDVPGLGKPFGFAVDTLRIVCAPGTAAGGGRQAAKNFNSKNISRQNVFTAPAGATVEVALPDEYPELPLGAPVYCASSQAVKRQYRFTRPKPGQFRVRRPVDIEISLTENELSVSASCASAHPGQASVCMRQALAGPFQRTQDEAKMTAALSGVFEKLGETSFTLRHFSCANPAAFFVPISRLNQLRRQLTAALQEALEAAQAQRSAKAEEELLNWKAAPSPPSDSFRWSLKVDRLDFLQAFTPGDWREVDEIIVEIARDPLPALAENLHALAARASHAAIRLALPILTRKWEEQELREKIERLYGAGWTNWEASNLSAWNLLPPALVKAVQNHQPASANRQSLSADWPLYVTNRAAALQLLSLGAERFTLSPEDGLANMRALLEEFGAKATVIIHQDTPLMISEACAWANLKGACPGKDKCRFAELELAGSRGGKIAALNQNCRTLVLNRTAFCLAGRLRELASAGAVRLRADFICRAYQPEEVRRIWQLLRTGQNVPGGHAANFDRGLL